MRTFRIVAAIDPLTGGIGHKGGMAWVVPPDLEHFRRLTLGGVVIMGRGTWESLPGPLDGRTCIVLSRKGAQIDHPNVTVEPSLDAALSYAETTFPDADVWVIGGQSVFEEAIEHPACVGAEITEIWSPEFIPYDRVFPIRSLWIHYKCLARNENRTHGKYSYRFLSYGRTGGIDASSRISNRITTSPRSRNSSLPLSI